MRGHLTPYLWLRQICGFEIDGKDLYKSKVLKEFIKSDNPAEFIRQHQTKKWPEPSGAPVRLDKEKINGEAWISNPYKAVLRLVGSTKENTKNNITIKFNDKIAYNGPISFDKSSKAVNIKIPKNVQIPGNNKITLIYKDIVIEKATVLF